MKKDPYYFNENVKGDINRANMRALVVPFASNDSMNRLMLSVSAFNQGVPLENPEPPLVDSIFTNGLVSSTWNINPDNDVVILKRVDKVMNGRKTNTTFIIFMNKDTGELGVFESKKYIPINGGYGIENISDIDDKHEGDTISSTEYLQRSKNYKDEGFCWGGVNLRTVYSISPNTCEDSVGISKKAAEKMSYMKIDDFELFLDTNNFLLKNLYGTDDEYKPFPNVGDKVNDKDILLAYSPETAKHQIIRTPESSKRVEFNDIAYYVDGGSEIVDIEVLCSSPDSINDKYLKQLHREHTEYLVAVDNAIKDVVNKYPANTQSFELIQYQDRMNSLLNGVGLRSGKKTYGANVVYVRLTFYKSQKLRPGNKITGRDGNKGVVSTVSDRVEYKVTNVFADPIFDEHGNEIDVVVNTLGVPNRSNMGQMYEKMTNTFRFAIFDKFKDGKDNRKFLDVFTGMLSFIAPEMCDEFISYLQDKNIDDVATSILKDNITILTNPYPQPIDHPSYEDNVLLRFWKCFQYLKSEDINVCKSDVYMLNPRSGKLFKMLRKKEISTMYFIVLEQTPEKKFVTRTMGSYDAKGTPTKTRDKKERRVRYANTPVKIGERDFVIQTTLLPEEELIKFLKSTDSDNVDVFLAFLKTMGVELVHDTEHTKR